MDGSKQHDYVSADFDYSTPPGREAVSLALDLVLALRQELKADSIERKVALYERTLGLAVIPVLLRRTAIRLRAWLVSHHAGRQ